MAAACLRWFRTPAEAEAAGYRPSEARGCAPQLDTALIVPRPNGRADCTVRRIIDGDTFQCEGGSRVRLLIADAFEIGQNVYADSAVSLLERLIPVGSRVQLEFDVAVQDRGQRILAHVLAGGVSVNRELLRRGLADVLIVQPNVEHLEALRAARDSARQEGAGGWRDSGFACSAAGWRAGRCRRRRWPVWPWTRTAHAGRFLHGCGRRRR